MPRKAADKSHLYMLPSIQQMQFITRVLRSPEEGKKLRSLVDRWFDSGPDLQKMLIEDPELHRQQRSVPCGAHRHRWPFTRIASRGWPRTTQWRSGCPHPFHHLSHPSPCFKTRQSLRKVRPVLPQKLDASEAVLLLEVREESKCS
jgi:hypothetical protein